MITIEEAAKAVGLSARQLRRRIEVCRPLLAPYLRRGDKNRLLLDNGAVQVVRAIEDRRAMGATLEESMAYVADSIGGEQGSEQEPTIRQAEAKPSELVQALQLVIDNQARELEDTRKHIEHLQNQVDKLMSLALPRPRRRLFALFSRAKPIAAV